MRTVAEAQKDARISYINEFIADECPTDACRNKIVLIARKLRADVLFSVDHDNIPHPNWFNSCIDYLQHHPCVVIAAPYCGSRPLAPHAPDRPVHVYVKDESNYTGRRQITREEAKTLTGFRPAVGVATCLAMQMSVFEKVPMPWWSYRYLDDAHSESDSEDYVFSDNCVKAGVPIVVNWDCWAFHCKQEVIGKPE
jgi:hypothetical protein